MERGWSVPLIREVPDYFIDDENIIISVAGDNFCAFPIRVFQMGSAKANRVIADHYAKRAEVVPFKARS